MKREKLNNYKITSAVQKGLTKFTFNNGKHEAMVKAASIKFSRCYVNLNVSDLTLSDLKKLKRTVSKLIKELEHENNQSV